MKSHATKYYSGASKYCQGMKYNQYSPVNTARLYQAHELMIKILQICHYCQYYQFITWKVTQGESALVPVIWQYSVKTKYDPDKQQIFDPTGQSSYPVA